MSEVLYKQVSGAIDCIDSINLCILRFVIAYCTVIYHAFFGFYYLFNGIVIFSVGYTAFLTGVELALCFRYTRWRAEKCSALHPVAGMCIEVFSPFGIVGFLALFPHTSFVPF